MFLKNSNITFIFVILVSTIMVVSSSSWMTAWLSLEVNMMSIIPILLVKQGFECTSSSIKYFLIQAMASMVMIVMFLVVYSYDLSNMMNINNEIILMALAMKSGIPPFHFWLPQVIEMMDVIQMFMILSWQKIAPFSLMSFSLSSYMSIMVCLSAAVGAVGGYNQNSIKKILVYSSMTHGAWMISAMTIKSGMWAMYFVIYNISLVIMCFIINKMVMMNISDINNMFMKSSSKFIFMSNLLSMSGLPPFIGFAAKFMVIKCAMNSMAFMMVMFILMMSFMSVFYYMKMCFSSFILSDKKMFKKKKMTISSWGLLLVVLLNMVVPMLVYLS